MGDMNFLPEDYLEKRAQRRTNALCFVLFLIVMGAIVAAFFWTDRQRTDVRELRQQVDAQFEEAAKRLEQLDQLQQRKKVMTQKARVTAGLLERVPRSLILSEITNRMPASIGLLDLKLETKEVKDTGAKAKTALDKAKQKMEGKGGDGQMEEVRQTEVMLRLTGVAPTDVEVSQFMSALGQSPLFDPPQIEFSQEEKISGQPLRKFKVAMELNQDVDLKRFEPTMVKRELDRDPLDQPLVPGRQFSPVLPFTPGNNPDVKNTKQ